MYKFQELINVYHWPSLSEEIINLKLHNPGYFYDFELIENQFPADAISFGFIMYWIKYKRGVENSPKWNDSELSVEDVVSKFNHNIDLIGNILTNRCNSLIEDLKNKNLISDKRFNSNYKKIKSCKNIENLFEYYIMYYTVNRRSQISKIN